MSIDIFNTHVLSKVVEKLERPSSFLLDAFFGQEQTEDSEEIHFDIDKSKPRLTPFVSPLVAGKVVDDEGFTTKSFKPAYAKDKRRFDPSRPLKRSIGEKIGGTLSPQQRLEANVNRTLSKQLENLTRREEVMASEALRTGKITVSGDNYPTVVVDFQRDPSLTVALAGGSRWGEAGVSALENLEDWVARIQEKSGAVGRTVVMDALAWRVFKADPKVEKLLDIRRLRDTADLALGPIAFGQGNDLARYVGTIGDLDFWVYNDRYVDDNDVVQKLLPDYTVLLGSPTQLEGTRCYGAIQDEKAGYRAQRFFSKSWLEEDPAVRWLLLQSAPLIVPYRPNASFCATVR
ncbi:major capsid protein [Micavibrio aeruginosavorus]|uniref:Putative capsid protein of prophage n=1 Tax=Micavibrio aeruginosavorus EPB TaxID=349215 RepID=M4VHS2_9BACT|nr:major capsid protein [Micavibrio aeruginosavorus]AGH98947.1 Putative capsid protein of prophage [Micavibrio aeruginosavorus EPB]